MKSRRVRWVRMPAVEEEQYRKFVRKLGVRSVVERNRFRWEY
jgi:hypothetical protein